MRVISEKIQESKLSLIKCSLSACGNFKQQRRRCLRRCLRRRRRRRRRRQLASRKTKNLKQQAPEAGGAKIT